MGESWLIKILRFLSSFVVTIPLLIAYATSCAVATFLENDFGTPSARAIVYNAEWFDLLHLCLGLNLLGALIFSKAWQRKKYASLTFHSSLLIILIGAALTRFYGFEGTMHIREGETSNSVTTQQEFLTVLARIEDKTYQLAIPVVFTPLYAQQIHEKFNIDNKGALEVNFVKFTPTKDKITPDSITLLAKYDGEEKEIEIPKDFGDQSSRVFFELGETRFAMVWGNREIALPFSLELRDFQLERYPGSNAPSSYASEITILDKTHNINEPYRIFMNNVLDYGGYRFFQSSYDQDELGTILSVNKDPGKIPTYIGYTLLTFGLLWNFFTRNGRFVRLGRFLESQKLMSVLLLCTLMLGTNLYAESGKIETHSKEVDLTKPQTPPSEVNQTVKTPTNEEMQAALLNDITPKEMEEKLNQIKQNSKEHAKKFGLLLVQDFGGRIKPVDTLALDFIHKITGKDNFLGFSNDQLFLAMLIYPDILKKFKMIQTKTAKLREIIGVDKNEKYIAFEDAFGDNAYKLANYLEEANRKKPALRDQFDKDVIAVDERINAAYLIYTAQSLRIFPQIGDLKEEYQKMLREKNAAIPPEMMQMMGIAGESEDKTTWYAPVDAMVMFNSKDSSIIQKVIQAYFFSYMSAIPLSPSTKEGEEAWKQADSALELIAQLQQKFGGEILPDSTRVDMEVFLNHYNIFNNLTYVYILLGVVLFLSVIIQIFRNQAAYSNFGMVLYVLIALSTILFTLGLAMRWYIGEHAPWSNAYESMIYIAWAGAISGVIFFRQSFLALSMASILAGISLFVAHLGFMDPQIGNLVPVLKSYWLNIHVSIITASYGFLGLCFMLGVLTLLLFIFRSKKYPQLDSTILSLHAINEMSMILGLSMLTVGNFLGGVWANESWGRYWGWDPKETWALISIVVYVIVLHIRFLGHIWNTPFVFASLSVVAFYSILMTYFGVNFYLSGLHSYAAGDPLPIPTFLYYFVAGTILLIFLAFFKRKLPPPTLPA